MVFCGKFFSLGKAALEKWLFFCENRECGHVLGKAPTPLLIKGFYLEHLTKSTIEKVRTLTCGNHVNLGSGAWTGWPVLPIGLDNRARRERSWPLL